MNQNELLGTKKIGPLLAQMALPAITAQVVNMLYNIVDRIYIGHIPDIGAMALTGVGLCFPILMIITAFSSLIGMGGAPRVSMKLGKKENEGAETVMGGCFAALLVLAVVLTAAFLICGKPLLYLFGASENTIGYAQGYMNIYVMGTLFVMIALGMNPFITAQGFSTISMLTTLIGAIVNIVLDPVFIFVLGMGVQGAALATILSQCVSAIWVMHFLTGRRTVLRLKRKNIRLRASVILPVLALGVSPFIMTSTESLLNICFNTSLQKYGGDMAVGAMTIMSSVMQMMSLPIQGLAQGAQPIVSFNYGAGKLDRVKQAFYRLFWISVVVSTGFWALNMLSPTLIPSIFAGNAELKEMSGWANRIYMGGAFMLGVQFSCQQTFIALGEAKISLFLAFLRKIILLIPLIFILPNFFGDKVFAVFLAEPVADILAATTTFGMFVWKFKKIMAKV